MFSRDPTSGLKVKALGFPFLLWDIQAFLSLLLSGTKTVSDGRVADLPATVMVNTLDFHLHQKQAS